MDKNTEDEIQLKPGEEIPTQKPVPVLLSRKERRKRQRAEYQNEKRCAKFYFEHPELKTLEDI